MLLDQIYGHEHLTSVSHRIGAVTDQIFHSGGRNIHGLVPARINSVFRDFKDGVFSFRCAGIQRDNRNAVRLHFLGEGTGKAVQCGLGGGIAGAGRTLAGQGRHFVSGGGRVMLIIMPDPFLIMLGILSLLMSTQEVKLA